MNAVRASLGRRARPSTRPFSSRTLSAPPLRRSHRATRANGERPEPGSDALAIVSANKLRQLAAAIRVQANAYLLIPRRYVRVRGSPASAPSSVRHASRITHHLRR